MAKMEYIAIKVFLENRGIKIKNGAIIEASKKVKPPIKVPEVLDDEYQKIIREQIEKAMEEAQDDDFTYHKIQDTSTEGVEQITTDYERSEEEEEEEEEEAEDVSVIQKGKENTSKKRRVE